MTHFDPTPSDTLVQARTRYFETNGFGADGGYNDAWVDFKLGPIPMPFPNTKSRLRAVRYHDLHHVLTGYETDVAGEFEISAWEIGSGCADHFAAWQLNLGGMAAGMFYMPKRIWKAFVRGRHSRNLYREQYDDALLARRVDEAQRSMSLIENHAATASDVVLFAGAIAAGLITGTLFVPFLIPAAIVGNAVSYFARRAPKTAG